MKFFFPSRDGHSQTPRFLVVLLCVLLILFVGATQTLHSHASNEAANPGCSLCAVAHVTALPTPVPASPVVAEVVDLVPDSNQFAEPNRFFSFSLYVRPPPAAAAHS